MPIRASSWWGQCHKLLLLLYFLKPNKPDKGLKMIVYQPCKIGVNYRTKETTMETLWEGLWIVYNCVCDCLQLRGTRIGKRPPICDSMSLWQIWRQLATPPYQCMSTISPISPQWSRISCHQFNGIPFQQHTWPLASQRTLLPLHAHRCYTQ